jgi:hypothetical protein
MLFWIPAPPISRGQAFAGMTMLTAFEDYDTVSGRGHEAASFALN